MPNRDATVARTKRRRMTELTEQDLLTLRRLSEFYLDRSKYGTLPRRIVCEAVGGICARMVVCLERNGRLSPADDFDAAGRVKPKSDRSRAKR